MKSGGEKGVHSALTGKAVMSNTPGTGWAIVHFQPERALLYDINLYISTVLTLLCLPYHQLWRGPWVLCGQSSTLCAWSAPDWSQLKSTSVRTDTAQNGVQDIIYCTLWTLYGCMFDTKNSHWHLVKFSLYSQFWWNSSIKCFSFSELDRPVCDKIQHSMGSSHLDLLKPFFLIICQICYHQIETDRSCRSGINVQQHMSTPHIRPQAKL